MKMCALLFGFLAAATVPTGAGERLTIRVSPTVAFAPANLVVRTMVLADAKNRAIEIIAESADFYRSSRVQLDGDHAPRSTQFEFRSVPSGTYEVKAILLDVDEKPLTYVRQSVNVIQNGAGR